MLKLAPVWFSAWRFLSWVGVYFLLLTQECTVSWHQGVTEVQGCPDPWPRRSGSRGAPCPRAALSSSVPGEVSFVPASRSAGEGACFWLPCSVFNCVFCFGSSLHCRFLSRCQQGLLFAGVVFLVAVGHEGFTLSHQGFIAPWHVGSSWTGGSNPCLLHWQADFYPLRPQGSPVPPYS